MFACVAGRPEGIALTRLAHVMRVEKERSLIMPLGRLEEEGLIACSDDHYSLINTKKSATLKMALSFAMAYGYDYNSYFSSSVVEFLKNAYRTDYFSDRDVPIESIKPDIVARMIHNDLLLVYSYKPFIGKVVANPFLDGLCEYLGLRRAKPFLFRKKIQLEQVLCQRAKALQEGVDEQVRNAIIFLGEEGLRPDGWGLSTVSAEIRDSIEKEDTDLFDPESSACYDNAWKRMHANVDRQEPLSLQAIRNYHSLAMANTTFAGILRDHEVFVRNNPNFKTAKPTEISPLLEGLIDTAAHWKPQNFLEALEFAAYIYNQFIFIHPFQDGNSRTARVIMAHVLNLCGMPFDKIPSSFEVRFLQVTKGLKKRDDEELKYVLEEIFLNYLNRQELEMALAETKVAPQA